MDKKKMANNILEFLIDPTRVPVERRVYHRPEEQLDNRSFEKAKLDSMVAYGDQRHNSDMYPSRKRSLTQREVLGMERKDIIASLDVLSQEFPQNDAIGKDLRSMAYVLAKMNDEAFENRMAKAETFECPECGTKVLKQTGYCVKCKKKVKSKAAASEEEISSETVVLEDKWTREASEAVKASLLSEKGVEAKGWTPPKEESEEEEKKEAAEDKEAKGCDKKEDTPEESKKEAGKIKGPGKPDGTGPMSGTDECPMSKKEESESKKKADEKEAKGKDCEETSEGAPEEKKKEAVKEDDTLEEEKKEDTSEKKEATEEKKADDKEADEKVAEEDKVVNTDVLATEEFDGIELSSPMAASDMELSDTEKKDLDRLFHASEDMTADERSKLDELLK